MYTKGLKGIFIMILMFGLVIPTSLVLGETNEKKATSYGSIYFEVDDSPTDPLDPTDPSQPVEPEKPGQKGPLSLDFVSSLDFGTQEISKEDRVYYATTQQIKQQNTGVVKQVPHYVQVTDKRGQDDGWIVQVRQNGPLKAATSKYPVLTGAIITWNSPKSVSVFKTEENDVEVFPIELNENGVASTVMNAKAYHSFGTWLSVYGEETSLTSVVEKTPQGNRMRKINPAVSLFVPGKTPKDAAKYYTSLTWELSSVPVE
ncbi:WxL domain-containing protein [Vagococcus humatus]|uniref:WxL domain-containing protein n=1 Tax=Vagococcus humatus TaxID=1889241 RepID=A0A429Z509_9ENTE|nr:WxL domain-containing protein [Vagococcus humatus]RST88782.1 WxL domain-containing protein [Vagococcus humatus]